MKRHLGSIVALMCLLLTYKAGAQTTEISQQEAFNQVSKLFEGRDVDYYIAEKEKTDDSTKWVFFIDADPNAFWGHECYLVHVPRIVEDASQEIPVLSQEFDFPPKEYIRKPYLVKERHSYDFSRQIVVETTEPLRASALLGHSGGNTYAVLISGCSDITLNSQHFWNECSFMYQVLTKRYGIPKENIYPLISDGSDPAVDMVNSKGKNISSPLDLDNDGEAEIEMAASKTNVVSVLTSLQSRLNPHDQLFVFITNHGNQSIIGLWSPENADSQESYITHKELRNLFLPFINNDVCVNAVTGSCYSGGLVDLLSNDNNCIVAAASDSKSPAYYYESAHEYVSFINLWISAVNGADSDNKAVNADRNKDGVVSMDEAFDYAKSRIYYYNERSGNYQNSQYVSTPKRLGEELAFNRQPSFDYSYNLVFSNNKQDNTYEPYGAKDIFWHNSDICIREHITDPSTEEFQNPVFPDSSRFCRINVTIHNDGKDTYTKGKSVVAYWAQASTNISRETWLGKNFFYGYSGQYSMGGIIACRKLERKIESGESGTFSFYWRCPKDLLDDEFRPDNHHFAIFVKIIDDGETEYLEKFDALSDPTAAQSNVAMIYKEDVEKAATVFINNSTEQTQAYSLELGFRTADDMSILRYAHIALDMSQTVFHSWYYNGGGGGAVAFYNRSPFCVEFLSYDSKIENIVFNPNAIGRATLYIDFFDAPYVQRTYTFDLIQRDNNGTIVGGETFVVQGPSRLDSNVSFDSKALENGILELRANTEETGSVKWFTADNQYAGSGKVLRCTPEMRSQDYMMVVTNEDGELARKEITVQQQLGIREISPAGCIRDYIDVIMHEGSNCGYILNITSLLDGSTIYSKSLAPGELSLRIDMAPYKSGFYVISCVLNNKIINSYKFEKK